MSGEATILGAGVAGLVLAAELCRRGVAVTLVDRETGIGPHACSWWAGGMLAPFCEAESAEEPVTRLGRDAADWWEGQGAGVTRNGSLVLALSRDRGELDRFARRTTGHARVDGDAIAALEPQLAGRFDRGLFFEAEAHLNPRAALAGLRTRLDAAGVRFVEGEGWPREAAGTRFDCRGLAARDRLDALRGVKGEMVLVHAPDVTLHRPVRLLHPRHPIYVVPRGEGTFMIGATQIESGERQRVSVRALLELLSAAYALDPAFADAALIETGTDARPAFPDNLPRLVRRGDTLFLNGLFRHGFLLAPVLARMAADWLGEGRTSEFWHEDTGQR